MIHEVAIQVQVEGLQQPAPDANKRWYFYCTCGVCGPLRRSWGAAATEGALHERQGEPVVQ